MQNNKPLISMTEEEIDRTFDAVAGLLHALGLERCRKGLDQAVQFVAAVLTTVDGEDRIICAYEEYGDGENEDICDDVIKETRPLLRKHEKLRRVVYEVDMTKVRPVEFPTEELLAANDHEGRRRNGSLCRARGTITFAVIWLVTDQARLLGYDIEHGDGVSIEENVKPAIRSITHCKLLHKNERLEVICYEAPASALSVVTTTTAM